MVSFSGVGAMLFNARQGLKVRGTRVENRLCLASDYAKLRVWIIQLSKIWEFQREENLPTTPAKANEQARLPGAHGYEERP